MDAQAYLIRHGWSGPGNPLNPSRRPGAHGGLGLTRPLLISRRENKIGIGQKSTKDPTNQWWLRGFEEALRGVGQNGSASPATTEDGIDGNCLTRNGSQLYKFFVRGEVIPGTLDKEKDSLNSAVASSKETSKDSKGRKQKEKNEKKERGSDKGAKKGKRKREQEDNGAIENDDRKRKEEKRKKRKLKEAEVEAITSGIESSKKSKKSKTERLQSTARSSDDGSHDQHSDDKKKHKKKKDKKRKSGSISDYPTPGSSTNEESMKSAKATKDEKSKDKTKESEKKKEKKNRRKDKKEATAD